MVPYRVLTCPPRPLSGERRERCSEGTHAIGIERVVDLGALSARAYEAGLEQNLQVLANRRLADREDLGEVACAGAALVGET